MKKRGSDARVNCSNKDQGSTRNVYFCRPAYTLVKLALGTACAVHVSVLRPAASCSATCFMGNTCNSVDLRNGAG